jgi:hypothetical protein
MLSQRAIAVCRFSLATILLLANGTGPALQHAHADGETRHTHDAPATEIREAGHKHSHVHPHTAELSGFCSHLHFSVLGIAFTSLPPNPDDDSDQWPRLVLSPLGGGSVVGDLSGSECNPLVVVNMDDRLAETRPISHWADRFASMPAVAAPLCDTARHERSGVQLI